MLSTDPKLARKKGEQEDAEAVLNGSKDALDVPTMSTATMRLYKSAVKWYHDKCRKAFVAAPEPNSMEINEEEVSNLESLDAAWEAMIKGYEKIIAAKKERGIMSVTEGTFLSNSLKFELLTTFYHRKECDYRCRLRFNYEGM